MTTLKNSLPVACVLLPAYNEAENIEKTIFRILKLENITTHKIHYGYLGEKAKIYNYYKTFLLSYIRYICIYFWSFDALG